MRFPHGFVALSLTSLAVASFNASSPVTYGLDESTPATTDRYIVEFASDIDYETAVGEIQSQPGIKLLKKFRSSVFSGVSIQSSDHSPGSLQDIAPVTQAWRSRSIKLSSNVEASTFSDGVEASNYSVHGMTGVDKVHALGNFGKGAKVAIVDTGVDYNHPALGGGFGPGYKVAGGYDLVGDGEWPNESKQPDGDPMDQQGRGTHVAGIVAGKSDWYVGVAPEATILAYKVFNELGYTDDETLIDAFIQAYEDGADIISAGLNTQDGWSTGAWATVASRLVDEGVVVTIAAGDDGARGPFFAGSGSSGENVLAVASVEPSTILGIPFMATFETAEGVETYKIGERPGPWPFPTTMTNASLYATSLDPNVTDDACSPLPDSTPDLADKIVLVRISTQCWDYEQVENIIPYNPLGILFYHNEDKTFFNPWANDEVYMAIIAPEPGAAMVEALAAGGSITLDFSHIDGYVNLPVDGGGVPSVYTSWGGTFDLQLKPDIAAPGSTILSTYPTWLGSYTVMGGTSMATAYIAGVAALYIGQYGGRSIHGKDFAKTLNARITASGRTMSWAGLYPGGDIHLASPTQVGTGLIDAFKVLNYTTQLSFTRFLLNDTHHFSRYQSVDITNDSGDDVIYTFAVEDAGGYDAFATNKTTDSLAPVINSLDSLYMYTLKAEVAFPTGTFRVKAGQTKKAQFTFKVPTLPEGHQSANLPVISGKIIITGSNGEQVSVPYFGMIGDLKKEMRISNMFWTSYGSPTIITSNGPDSVLDVWQKPYWGFDMTTTNQDYPLLVTTLIWGARELRWDIYEAGWGERNWKYPPVPGQNGYIGSATSWRNSEQLSFDPAIDDADDVFAMPDEYLRRQYSHVYMWFGKLADGTQIAPGNYTMRIAALLPFGDRAASDNWDVMDVPEIMILPPKKSQ